MKILLLNDYGTATGGAEFITASLREELRRRGHDARLFASSARTSTHSIGADYECFGTVSSLRTLNQCVNLRAAFSLRRVLRQFRPDVIHVNLYLTQLSPWILPVINGIPSVYYAQWFRAICPLGTRRMPSGERCTFTAGASCLRSGCLPFHDWIPLMAQIGLDRRWGANFTRIVAISQWVADQFDKFGPRHLQHAQVIRPGTPLVTPRDCMSEHPTVVFAGRLVTEKGVHILIRSFAAVFAENPSCRLVIVGDGPQRAALECLSKELRLDGGVTFHGYVTHARTLEEIRRAWVVCVPSLWDEPFGLIAAEAQMNGVAVIASNSGGLREIVRDRETGFLVEPGQSDQWASSIGRVLANRDQAIALGTAGHGHASVCFNTESFTDRFETVYRSLVESSLNAN